MPIVTFQRGSVSSDAGWQASKPQPSGAGPLRVLRRLLAGLNQLLKLSDFDRGDIFRD